ncbi:MAG TPA: SRPBCC family protein [Flavobacteriales bacterium]|nr:SRPBCC family protein [Flavobacteriales bacterium]
MSTATRITISTLVNKPVAHVWKIWTEPAHIMQWNAASYDWHCPKAENDLRTGGSFSSTMAARDGSFSFDFGGVYDDVQLHKRIAYTMGDGRTCEVLFTEENGGTRVVESFDAEAQNPVEMQRTGWQAILDRFKRHAESQGS